MCVYFKRNIEWQMIIRRVNVEKFTLVNVEFNIEEIKSIFN